MSQKKINEDMIFTSDPILITGSTDSMTAVVNLHVTEEEK
jgi:hypothetical protein